MTGSPNAADVGGEVVREGVKCHSTTEFVVYGQTYMRLLRFVGTLIDVFGKYEHRT